MAAAVRAVPTVQVDDDLTRVTEWRFAAGAETGWHRHEFAYVVVPLTTGTLELEGPGGERRLAPLEAGASYARPAGVEHNVRNASGHEFAFVEVEFKSRPG